MLFTSTNLFNFEVVMPFLINMDVKIRRILPVVVFPIGTLCYHQGNSARGLQPGTLVPVTLASKPCSAASSIKTSLIYQSDNLVLFVILDDMTMFKTILS